MQTCRSKNEPSTAPHHYKPHPDATSATISSRRSCEIFKSYAEFLRANRDPTNSVRKILA